MALGKFSRAREFPPGLYTVTGERLGSRPARSLSRSEVADDAQAIWCICAMIQSIEGSSRASRSVRSSQAVYRPGCLAK
jgi:hypothetical protein